MPPIILEVCVDSIAGALAAQEGGAKRVELCAALFEGGITPSAATIELARRHLAIDLNVMIRPRGGDFLYSDLEYAIMQRDIELAKGMGANGIVIGLLTPDGNVDVPRTQELVELARPMSVTFHRAFDMVADPSAALDSLIGLGLDRVLTSGLEPTALEGAETIAELIRQAAGRIIVMPGGGINERNITKIVRQTGAVEIHMSGRRAQESQMRYRNSRINLGGALHPPEYSQQVTAATRISASLAALQSGDNRSAGS
jgi:copper homeostasis protein